MVAVGLDLYAQLLDEAVRTLRGQPAKTTVDPDLNIQVNARIETYVPIRSSADALQAVGQCR